MNLRRRLEALWRAVVKRGIGKSCRTCGRQAGRGRAWVFDPDGDELGVCTACGRPVDSSGEALGVPGPDGRLCWKTYGFPDPV